MSEEELRAILVHLRRMAPEKRILNITGGEPTQHPQFERLIALAREEGIRRVTISTHGLRFLQDEWLLERLKALDARVILSFDSFTDAGNQRMLGGNFTEGKRRVLELLEKHDVDTTLLPVLARGINDHEIGQMVRLALEKDFIRSVEFHNMTFTGQSGASFERAARYTTFDVLQDLQRQSAGRLAIADFVPSPAAHPLCYSVTYLLRLAGGWTPFPRFMKQADLRAMLAGTLYLEPGPEMESRLQDVIHRLWAGEIPCQQTDEVLAALRSLLERVFDPGLTANDRLRIAERSTKAIYVHSHMDEETFDTDRIQQCCVGMPAADGSNIPSCAYNVLYRQQDARFVPQTAPALVTLGKGRFAA
jgi:7,8-dihydro-6-hydroxymethylpterin dimethyltransferase